MNFSATSNNASRDKDLRINHSAARRSSDKLAVISCGAGCAYFVLHCLRVLFGNEETLMKWLYDDCFYYLITAKHFSEQHRPSFDGITVTSGYHPLWMWLCSILYNLHGKLDLTYVRSCMALSIGITAGMLVAVVWRAVQRANTGVLWALALATTSYSALNNGLTIMEWPLVVLCWLLLHRLMVNLIDPETGKGPQKGAMVAAFLIGFAGALSRSDFGLITVCYLAAAGLIARRFGDRRSIYGAVLALCGAISGVGLDFLYNKWMTGEWLQTSAEVKRAYAALVAPFNPAPAAWQFARVLLYFPPLNPAVNRGALIRTGLHLMEIAAVCVIALILLRGRWIGERLRRRWADPKREDMILIACALGVAGYLLVYGLDSQATYGWYTATVTGFVVVGVAYFFGRMPQKIAAAIVLPLMACNIAAAEYYGGNATTQMQEVATGKRMHAEHPNALMGGGDVGKPSFYNGGTMINLDGLMNNEIYPYLISGRIHCYILDRRIEYLSEIGSISVPLTEAERAKRHEPAIPWSTYFIQIPSTSRGGVPDGYLKTDFDAIRASGECNH